VTGHTEVSVISVWMDSTIWATGTIVPSTHGKVSKLQTSLRVAEVVIDSNICAICQSRRLEEKREKPQRPHMKHELRWIEDGRVVSADARSRMYISGLNVDKCFPYVRIMICWAGDVFHHLVFLTIQGKFNDWAREIEID
jgi:hypothetical protein